MEIRTRRRVKISFALRPDNGLRSAIVASRSWRKFYEQLARDKMYYEASRNSGRMRVLYRIRFEKERARFRHVEWLFWLNPLNLSLLTVIKKNLRFYFIVTVVIGILVYLMKILRHILEKTLLEKGH